MNYLFFWGHSPKSQNIVDKSCLSQWFSMPFSDGVNEFKTAEHYMMFKKAQLFNDYESMKIILDLETPAEAKAQGRKVKNFNLEIWNIERLNIVIQGNLLKFSQNLELKEFLLSSEHDGFVEASPFDPIWGIGMSESKARKVNKTEWKGLNLLGLALDEVYLQLKKGDS